MEQTSAPTVPGSVQEEPAGAATGLAASEREATSFISRGRIRRRLRFLRRARELAYRDLGGLVFSLHRFGARNDELVLAKLNLLSQIDGELHALQRALSSREPVTVLREAGITPCPRCAAIHSSEDHYCPNCGLSLGRHPDLPFAGAPPHAAGADAVAPTPPTPAVPPAGAPAAATQVPPAQVAAAASAAAPVPAPAPARPATPAAASSGRSPTPPSTSADDEPTEIVRPPAGE